MSRFFYGSDSSSEGSSDEEELYSGDEAEAQKSDESSSSEDDSDDEGSGSDSDSDSDDEDQWNAVCVACLRVYSRDPDLTITLVEGNQGASSLVRGREPAGATM